MFEIIHPRVRRGPCRAVLFDFDGTLSLIREGWPQVMIGMMAGILRDRNLAQEPDEELWGGIERFVMALNGHPSIVQMERFAEEIAGRGGHPEPPSVYLKGYLDRLLGVVSVRWDLLTAGRARPAEWVVPGAHDLLGNLQSRGILLALASGTDRDAVIHEGRLLDVLRFFGEQVHAPAAGDSSLSKGKVIDRLLESLGIPGEELLGFGDGVVEATEVKRVGGTFVGVASVEQGQKGVHVEKRKRLIAAGADLIVPDYSDHEDLLAWLFKEQ